MKNMKNITDFKKFRDFKKINEEVSSPTLAKSADIGGYGGGSGVDTYGANVKGNFAGAENTLIGSAVIKIFGFFRRKINEGILFIYKKALFREYLANVFRYAAKNNITYQDENTLYDVKQMKNAEGVEEEKESIKVKFVSVSKDKKKFTSYEVSSKVLDEKNKVIADGTYENITENSIFVVKSGIIESIEDIPLSDPNSEEVTTQVETQLQPQPQSQPVDDELSNVGDDVKEIAVDVTKILKNIKNISDDELNQYIKKIWNILENIRLSGILEIDHLLKNKNLLSVDKEILEKDRKVYVDEQTILKKLYNSLKETKNNKTTSTPVAAAPIAKPVKKEIPTEAVVSDNQSFGFESDNILNEELKITKGASFRGVKLGGVDKKLADEVGNLDLKVLEDPNFAKQFEDKSVKDGVTALVKENSQPIQKIQLAAERIYKIGTPTTATAKLENTWQRMVKDDLTLFSRYMNTEEISPFVLVSNATPQTKEEAEKFGKGTEDTGRDSLLSKNAVLSIKEGFSNVKGGYGLLKTNLGTFIYKQQPVIIGGGTHWSYKAIGVVDLDKLHTVKEASGITECVDYDKTKLSNSFKAKPVLRTNNGGDNPQDFDGHYQCTYIIYTGKNHLSTIKDSSSPRPNDVILLSLYVKDGENIGNFDQTEYQKSYFFTYRDKNTNENVLLRRAPKILKNIIYSLGVNYSFQITDNTADNYKIPDNDIRPKMDGFSNLESIQSIKLT